MTSTLQSPGEDFMRTMRINTLSVFLAIKYASSAMMKADPAKGKMEEGGSIILTASGTSIYLILDGRDMLILILS